MTISPDGTQPLLSASGISKTYGQATVLRDANLAVQSGEIHGLLGGNGSGKSTLIKGLAGVVQLDPGGHIGHHGEMHPSHGWSPHHARLAHLRFVHQDLGLFPEMSVVENLAVGNGFDRTSWGRIRWSASKTRARQTLDRFGIAATPQTKVGALRLAERTMLAIGRALKDVGPEERAVIFLDEPTGALPAGEAAALHESLRSLVKTGHAVVLVTHDLDEALSLCDNVTLLRDGIRIHHGAVVDLDRTKLIDMIVGDTRTDQAPTPRRVATSTTPQPVLAVRTVRGAGLAIDELVVRSGEVLGLAGQLNAGASTLLQSLFGLVSGVNQELSLDGKVVEATSPREAMASGIAYLPSDRQKDGAFYGLPVTDNLIAASLRAVARHGWINARRERREAHSLTTVFRVRPPDPTKRIESLSGGNQQKVLLARWVRRRPRVLLLDDPTRGVDVGARADIWDLLHEEARSRGLAVLVTSSDPEELATYCDRVLVLGNGRIHAELAGPHLSASSITAESYAAAEPQGVPADAAPAPAR